MKILYLVQRYRPPLEATSKEISLLSKYFNGSIFDLHLDGYCKFKVEKNLISHHFMFYPFSIIPLYLLANNRIIHIYSNLCDRPYLPFFKSKNTIISSTNFITVEKIIPRIKELNSLKKIIIQSEVQKKELIAAGINEEKIDLIYPPVNLNRFCYKPSRGVFTILCASTPAKTSHLKKRGVNLLLSVGPLLQNIKIKFLLRGIKEVEGIIKSFSVQNITTDNQIYADMNHQYAQIHCTIIPYLQLDGYLKLVPTSVIESLAAGKPVLVSSKTGIAEIVTKEKCGVVFEPNKESLLKAIDEIKNNYSAYQKNCRKTAEKYFSQEIFLKKHEEIYNSIL